MGPLSKFGFALSAAASVTALGTGWPTEGSQTGEIRVYSWDQSKEVGCLTSAGEWTASADACGSFTATSLGPVTLDLVWTELEIETSAGSQCWFPNSSNMELVCDDSVSDTLWLHSEDFQLTVFLIHGHSLDSYVPLHGKAPTGDEAVALKGAGQSWDGDNYQLIWMKN
ncbi:hypothetical protein DL769_010901 [Monosporascus sp. CRB-8-3]|nr:hypothetical protein DL769_010901 [Monosporascus sp. CRB-8-3]